MTDAELTILSLVAEGPHYGHEIQQMIDERGLREWLTVGFSSVYYILNRLEQQHMITSELRIDGRNPARKLYQITEAGRGVLQTAVADLLRQPHALGTGFELGLANLHVLKPHQVYKVLADHRGDLKYRLHTVEASWQRQQENNGGQQDIDHIHALFTHSITLMRAELEWLTTFLADWLRRYPGADRSPEPAEIPETPTNTITQIHRRTTPDPAKMIQRLKRPPTREE
jgi:DNA-binding PadR family transcriptional regulator